METEKNLKTQELSDVSTEISCEDPNEVLKDQTMDITGQNDLKDKQESEDMDIDVDIDIYYDEEEEVEESDDEMEEVSLNVNLELNQGRLSVQDGDKELPESPVSEDMIDGQIQEPVETDEPKLTEQEKLDIDKEVRTAKDETNSVEAERQANIDEDVKADLIGEILEDIATEDGDDIGIKLELEEAEFEGIELEETDELVDDFDDDDFAVKLAVEEEENQMLALKEESEPKMLKASNNTVAVKHETDLMMVIDGTKDISSDMENSTDKNKDISDETETDSSTEGEFIIDHEGDTTDDNKGDVTGQLEAVYEVDSDCVIENENSDFNFDKGMSETYTGKADTDLRKEEKSNKNIDEGLESDDSRKIEFALEFEEDSSLENAKLYAAEDNTADKYKLDTESSADTMYSEVFAKVDSLTTADSNKKVEDSSVDSLTTADTNKKVEDSSSMKGAETQTVEDNETPKPVRRTRQSRHSSRDENLEFTVEHTEFLESGMLGFVMMERTEHAAVDHDVKELPALQIQESPKFFTAKNPQFEYESSETYKAESAENSTGDNEGTLKAKRGLTIDIEEVNSNDANMSPCTVTLDASVKTVRENKIETADTEVESFKLGILASSSAKELVDLESTSEHFKVDLDRESGLRNLDLKLMAGVKGPSQDFASPAESDGPMIINAALSEDEDYHRIMARTSELDFESDFGDSLDLVPGSDLEESQEWVSDEGKGHFGCCWHECCFIILA